MREVMLNMGNGATIFAYKSQNMFGFVIIFENTVTHRMKDVVG